MKHSVLLDTSFFIRLLNDDDPLHENALNYFRYYLKNKVLTRISTISIAEYCVKGNIKELPLGNLQIVPFNVVHAKRAGEFAEIIFTEKNITGAELSPRAIIPNDSKLFAQADCEVSTSWFVTSDIRSKKTISLLEHKARPQFQLIDISTPYNEAYGIFDFQ